MIAYLFAAVALAATPAGFRTGPGLPVRSLVVREAFVLDRAWVSQTTFGGRFAIDGWSLSGEVPLLAVAGNSPAVGQLRASILRHYAFRTTSHGIGVEVALAAPGRDTLHPEAWAESPRSALAAYDALIAYELATLEEGAWILRATLGVSRSELQPLGAAEVALSKVLPIGAASAVVIEGEVHLDWTGLAARALLRHELATTVAVDLGLQGTLGEHGTYAAPLAQIRGYLR